MEDSSRTGKTGRLPVNSSGSGIISDNRDLERTADVKMRSLKVLALSFVSLVLLSPAHGRGEEPEEEPAALSVSERKTRFHLGPIHVGAGWAHVRRHPYYPWFPWYRFHHHPFFLSPVDYMYPLYPFPVSHEGTGEVRLEDVPKEAVVFIDGGYAGSGGDLRKFRLQPGAYTLRMEWDGGEPFETRLYVLTGKTLRVRPRSREEAP
jgi:hypothetical protein